MRAAVIIVLPGSRNAISQFRTLQPWQGRLSCLSDLVRCCRGPHVDGCIESQVLVFRRLPNLGLQADGGFRMLCPMVCLNFRRPLSTMHPPFADPQAQCLDIHLLFQAVQNLVTDRAFIPEPDQR